jgi:hypothetical protein
MRHAGLIRREKWEAASNRRREAENKLNMANLGADILRSALARIEADRDEARAAISADQPTAEKESSPASRFPKPEIAPVEMPCHTADGKCRYGGCKAKGQCQHAHGGMKRAAA